MPLRLHNTLTKRAEPFAPADPAAVTFYTCGPTVYDDAHVGNFRAFLVSDLLRRWLESPLCEVAGPDGRPVPGPRRVVHVMNITDVGHMTDDAALDGAGEDKMQAAAQRLRASKKSGELPPGAENVDPADPYAIADFYRSRFLADAKRLGLKVALDAENDPRVMPRATEHVRAMLEVVLDLLKKNCAYEAGGAVYFDTQAFPDYGALSGNTLEKLRAGAGGRVDDANQATKKHPADFLLWKADASHLMQWNPDEVLGRETGLKPGYPGWHIECSAMSLEAFREILGKPDLAEIDLHSGGEDNIFPHHECEIAQSRCHTGADRFARCWLHARHLMVEGEKMSKSKGNFFTIRDLTDKGFDPAAIRLELIKTHYRANANFTEQGLRDSHRMIERWRRYARLYYWTVSQGHSSSDFVRNVLHPEFVHPFALAMNADLTISDAIGRLNVLVGNATNAPSQTPGVEDVELPTKPMSPQQAWSEYSEYMKSGDDRAILAALHLIDNVLGVIFVPPFEATSDQGDDSAILDLIAKREDARARKDFQEADRLRDELLEMGVEIKDGPKGTTWKRVARL